MKSRLLPRLSMSFKKLLCDAYEIDDYNDLKRLRRRGPDMAALGHRSMKSNPAVVFAITPFAIMGLMCCGGFGYFVATMPEVELTGAEPATPKLMPSKVVKKAKPAEPAVDQADLAKKAEADRMAKRQSEVDMFNGIWLLPWTTRT